MMSLPIRRSRQTWILRVVLVGVSLACAAAGGVVLDVEGTEGDYEKLIQEYYERTASPSVVAGIVAGGKLAWVQAFGVADRATSRPATPNTLYQVASVTKVFTATLAGILRDEGALTWDDPVERYLPDGTRLPQPDGRGDPWVSLRHLATHSSGIPSSPINGEPAPGDPWNGYPLDYLHDSFTAMNLEFPVGSEVRYSNVGVGLLGLSLERSVGEPYGSLLQSRLLDPLGMSDTGLAPTEAQRERYATGYLAEDPMREALLWDLGCLESCGALVSTVPDLARFVQLHLSAGREGTGVVRSGTLAEMQRPQRMLDAWGGAVGLGWILDRDEELGVVPRHNGGMSGHRSHVSLSPNHQVGVILLSNLGHEDGDGRLATLGRKLLRLAARDLGSVPIEIERVVSRLAAQVRLEPGPELVKLFHPRFLDGISLETIENELRRQHARGESTPVVTSLRPGSRERSARFVLRFANGKEVAGEIQVGTATPLRILYLSFED